MKGVVPCGTCLIVFTLFADLYFSHSGRLARSLADWQQIRAGSLLDMISIRDSN